MNHEKKEKPNTVPWVRKRHRVFLRILRFVVGSWMKRLGVEAVPFPDGDKRPHLILFNHQTPYDQFFPSLSFPLPVYYVATEDIFSMGLPSSLIRFVVAPIPIRKMKMDLKTIRTIMQVAKEGGTVAVAPEGNRTYSGKTEHINPSIAHLAKMLNLPIALYRIEGGYGVWPRWSSKTRKGKIRAYVSEVIGQEEIAAMSRDELYTRIVEGLTVNEAQADANFISDKKAEYIESAAYVCPYCGLSVFQSSGNEAECLTCHRKITYHEDKQITGVGFDFPFRFFNDWYEYQNAFINRLDLLEYKDACLFTDTADISEVIPYKKKLPLFREAEVSLYGDRIELRDRSGETLLLPFDEISAAAVLGHNKMNVYFGEKIYQFKSGKRFNALKYVNLYYRYQNLISEEENGEFLGL